MDILLEDTVSSPMRPPYNAVDIYNLFVHRTYSENNHPQKMSDMELVLLLKTVM